MDALLQFLVEQELISESDANELVTVGAKRELLGRILLRKRLLTVRQLMRALAIQADEPNAKLGEIVIREGYVSSKDVVTALEEQVGSQRTALELLYDSKRIAPEALISAVTLFLENQGQSLPK